MLDNIFTAVQETQNSGTSTFESLWYVVSIVGLWKMFEKAGTPGWPAIIPFYRSYKMCEVCMNRPWYWLRILWMFVPVVGWAFALYYGYQMYKAVAKSYGKPETYAWGLLFLTPVFYCMLGFGDAEYYGPMGIGDRRTSQARESKTVNFDVIRNEPSAGAGTTVRPEQTARKSEPEEETITSYPRGESFDDLRARLLRGIRMLMAAIFFISSFLSFGSGSFAIFGKPIISGRITR